MAFYPYTYSQVKVPAGTRQIMVLIDNKDFQAAAEMYYKVTSTLPSIDKTVDPTTVGYTAISTNNLISVTDNQYVTFSAAGKNTVPIKTAVTVVSMPDFTTIGSFTLSIQTVAGGATPDPINLCGISGDVLGSTFEYAEARITGITVPITLKLEYSGPFTVGQVYYYTDTNPGPGNCTTDSFSPSAYTMIPIFPDGTFVVNNNDYVYFGVEPTGLTLGSVTLTLRNLTGGNTILDTFIAQIK